MLNVARTAYRLAAGMAAVVFCAVIAAGCKTTAATKVAAVAAVPRSCPDGAELKGSPPPGGTEIWCEKDAGGVPVKDGVFVVYNINGDRMLEGYYDDGKQTGEWTMWYNNGQRASIDHYKNGLQDGLHVSWYANGAKAIEGNYRDGKREGVWHRWGPNGLHTWTDIYKDDIKVSSTIGNSPSGGAPGATPPQPGASGGTVSE